MSTLKIDLGCGKSAHAGFLGIDRRRFDGVDGVADLTESRWVFDRPTLGGTDLAPLGTQGFVLPDSSVSEAYCSHFLEHLEHNQRHPERVRFMNELWRVLVPGGKATIITPHWASNWAYGDFTHADKPVTEMFYFYLRKDWRQSNAPDNDIEFNPDGYSCNFEAQLGWKPHPELDEFAPEDLAFALKWYKEAALELHAALVAIK
jgi:predicted SAM-dependent methyltransferase